MFHIGEEEKIHVSLNILWRAWRAQLIPLLPFLLSTPGSS